MRRRAGESCGVVLHPLFPGLAARRGRHEHQGFAEGAPTPETRVAQAAASPRSAVGRAVKAAKPQPYLKMLEPLTYKGRRLGEVWGDFVTLSACALAPRVEARDPNGMRQGVREDEYLKLAKRYDAEGLTVMGQALGRLTEQMQEQPYTDLLGPDYLELQSQSSKRGRGEFFTPSAVSLMMAKMTMEQADVPLDGPLECMEPACGAGGMILAAAQVFAERGISPLRMRWTAIDLSKTSCDMTFVNTTLWGVPCVVVHGDTIRMPVDDSYHYGTYPNTWYPLARGATDTERRVELMKRLLKGEDLKEPDTDKVVDVAPKPLVLGKGYEQGNLF